MSDTVIRVENVSKKYKIGVLKNRHDTLRDQLIHGVKSLFRPRDQSNLGTDIMWALRDVSFEVKQGEVVGIIGRNGAGKSTLLKILSRITEPAEGRAELHGRVGSLLEVGTGFHPELTGRENVYLSGAILGMTKAEIDRKFDEIVAFAQVEKFIDTPVKRYSSGMYVRLGFAVAANLDLEILIIDEVLAVGDAAFQEKCLGTMQRSASSGKTVLFVSHNMPSVQHLCTRAMLLEAGRISATGRPSEVIGYYLSDALEGSRVSVREWRDRDTSGEGRIVGLEIADRNGQVTNSISVGGSVRFSILAEFFELLVDPCFGIVVHNAAGEPVLDIRSIHSGLRLGRVKGSIVLQASVENLGLYPGRYFLSPWISDSACSDVVDWVKLCSTLQVCPAPGPQGDLRLDPEWGKYWVPSNWTIR